MYSFFSTLPYELGFLTGIFSHESLRSNLFLVLRGSVVSLPPCDVPCLSSSLSNTASQVAFSLTFATLHCSAPLHYARDFALCLKRRIGSGYIARFSASPGLFLAAIVAFVPHFTSRPRRIEITHNNQYQMQITQIHQNDV